MNKAKIGGRLSVQSQAASPTLCGQANYIAPAQLSTSNGPLTDVNTSSHFVHKWIGTNAGATPSIVECVFRDTRMEQYLLFVRQANGACGTGFMNHVGQLLGRSSRWPPGFLRVYAADRYDIESRTKALTAIYGGVV